MAAKKKSRRKVRKEKPMQVVSLKAALHAVKTAERKIAARKMPRRNPELACDGPSPNPLRHFPKLKGRGRPEKKRNWDVVVRLKNGMVAEKKMRATKSEVYTKAQRTLNMKFHGSKVAEIIVDDGK